MKFCYPERLITEPILKTKWKPGVQTEETGETGNGTDPPRFDNRSSSKRSGRIPPSVKANADEVIRVIEKIPLPVSGIVAEDVQVDIARLNNPELRGKDYQKSSRPDENLRIATLMRDGYTCRICGRKHVRLEAHHIIPGNKGGKDTIRNLITLCESCHKKVQCRKNRNKRRRIRIQRPDRTENHAGQGLHV
ncbi:MAG: hypothetical protein GY749_18225 [Desulfobacteraceae bacterium]|nr:hypothetical protein [Desulfobacteraceae bacterium]